MSPQRQTDSAKDAQGRPLSVGDYILSLLVASQMGTVWGYCYTNCYPTFFAIPDLFDPHGLFVEGWIVYEDGTRVILMEHGWLISGQRIVDPTIVWGAELGQPVYYFPGLFHDRAELEALENEFFPAVRFSSYGDDGLGHPGYRMAYESAQQKARELLIKGKTFTEVRATVLASQDEGEVSEVSGFTIILLSNQQNGGV